LILLSNYDRIIMILLTDYGTVL